MVRTTAWGYGDEEDTWQVEVPGTAKVRELKAKIEDLYNISVGEQRLSLAAALSEPALDDDAEVEPLIGKKIYMNPEVLPSHPGEEVFAQALMARAEEDQAVMESLQGVTYKVNFERPQEAGGNAAGKKVTLELDALADIDTVQQMVMVEMGLGEEPAVLVFENRLMLPHLTLYQAGVEDGKTILVVKEAPPDEEQQQLLSLLGGFAVEGDAAPPAAATAAAA